MIFSYPPNLENYHCYSKCHFSHIIQNPAEIPNDVISSLWAYTLWYNVSLFMLFPLFHDPGIIVTLQSISHTPTISVTLLWEECAHVQHTGTSLFSELYPKPCTPVFTTSHTRGCTKGEWSSFLFQTYRLPLLTCVLPLTGLETARLVHPCLPIQAGIQAGNVYSCACDITYLCLTIWFWGTLMLPTLWQAWCLSFPQTAYL